MINWKTPQLARLCWVAYIEDKQSVLKRWIGLGHVGQLARHPHINYGWCSIAAADGRMGGITHINNLQALRLGGDVGQLAHHLHIEGLDDRQATAHVWLSRNTDIDQLQAT